MLEHLQDGKSIREHERKRRAERKEKIHDNKGREEEKKCICITL
jgi:hypothetical protein